MNGTKFFVCIIWLIPLSKLLTRAEERLNNCQISFNKTQSLKIFPGIKFFLTDSEINIHVRIHDLLLGIDSTVFTFAFYAWRRLRSLFFRDRNANCKKQREEEESFTETWIYDDAGAIYYAGFLFINFIIILPIKTNDKPVLFQILSLPGAIANIKMSLLKSIMVAQLAIAIMIYNLIKSSQDSEVVVIHKPYHHIHYRHGFPDDIEDEWFGR